MAGIVLPNTFTSQPTTYVPLDSKDPLSRDLCFLVNSALGPYDLVAKKYATTWNASRVATQKGIALSGAGAASKTAEWGYSPVNPSGAGSVTYAVLMNPISEARGAVAIGYIMNGSPFRQVSMLSNFDGNAGVASAGMFSIQSYAGSNQGYANAASVIDGNFHLFVGRYRVGIDAHIWVDGVNRTSANNIPGGTIGTDASMRISVGSESYSTTRTMDAEIPFAAAWNRALSDAEIVALTKNVWARQKAQPPRIWVAVSAPTGDGVGSASGTSTVSGTGASDNSQPGSASSTSTVSGIGASTAESVAVSSGTSTVSGVGNAAIDAVGSASGTSTVGGVGTSSTGSSGSASGTSSATGVGASVAASDGVANGVATVDGIGASVASATASGAGVATVSGVGDSVQAGSAVGNASGSSTVSGVGASVVAAVGSASGDCAVTGRGSSTGGEVESFSGGYLYVSRAEHAERRKKQRIALGIGEEEKPGLPDGLERFEISRLAEEKPGLPTTKKQHIPARQQKKLAEQEALNAELKQLLQLEQDREEEAIIRFLMEL